MHLYDLASDKMLIINAKSSFIRIGEIALSLNIFMTLVAKMCLVLN